MLVSDLELFSISFDRELFTALVCTTMLSYGSIPCSALVCIYCHCLVPTWDYSEFDSDVGFISCSDAGFFSVGFRFLF